MVVAVTAGERAGAALVDLEVYDASGERVRRHQQYSDNEWFGPNESRFFWLHFTPDRPGEYVVKVGVFEPGWAGLRHWNDEAARITAVANPAAGGGAAPKPAEPEARSVPALPSAPEGLPVGWPLHLALGVSSAPGEADEHAAAADFDLRYQYLAGGVNTGSGWANWNRNGEFVSNYIRESIANGFTPVFTYYQLVQSAPGNARGETEGVYANLQDPATTRAYFEDLRLFFERAGAFPGTRVVLHVEPDVWGFMQVRGHNDPAAVSARVSSTGIPELGGLPEDMRGFAQAIVRLRDRYAPNVALGYQLSVWGTGVDIALSDPPPEQVAALADRAAAYYQSLGADFDLVFTEFSDRDAGFKEAQYGDRGASWWSEGDFDRNADFLRRFHETTGERLVMWQIPLGNTRMGRNEWNAYADNRVEWLLADPTDEHLRRYIDGGVVALLFGRGADGATCACDTNNDGLDEDGGFFKARAREYYEQGPLVLP